MRTSPQSAASNMLDSPNFLASPLNGMRIKSVQLKESNSRPQSRARGEPPAARARAGLRRPRKRAPRASRPPAQPGTAAAFGCG